MQSTNKSNRKSFIYNNFTADPYPYPATTAAHPESFHPSISTGDPLPFRSRSNHIPVFSHDPRLSDSPHTENPPFRTMHTVWAIPFSVTPASPPVPEYRYRNPSALPPFRKFPGTAGSYSDFPQNSLCNPVRYPALPKAMPPLRRFHSLPVPASTRHNRPWINRQPEYPQPCPTYSGKIPCRFWAVPPK